MAKPTQAQRMKQIEDKLAALSELVDLLISERRNALEARDRDVRRQIGLRP